MRNLALTIMFGFFVTGCAIGNTHNYSVGDADFDLTSNKLIAVGTGDLRTYVVNGSKAPSFVGLRRGGFGNPFDVITESGKPLADDMTASLVMSLGRSGISARAATIAPGSNISSIVDSLLKKHADRYLLLVLHEWKADTYSQTSVRFNLELIVYGENGTQLARTSSEGKDAHPGAIAESDIEQMVVNTFREIIEKMVNDPKIRTVLE